MIEKFIFLETTPNLPGLTLDASCTYSDLSVACRTFTVPVNEARISGGNPD